MHSGSDLSSRLTKDSVAATTNVLADDEIHVPVAKFQNGVPQPNITDIRDGFKLLYSNYSTKSDTEHDAERFWTIPLGEMIHCGIKKYGDVNNLDKKRLGLQERIIHGIIMIPPGSVIQQYPLGGIFTFNPFSESVCGYVFTAWQDVSYLPQTGISHVAVFRKIHYTPSIREIVDAEYLTKDNVSEIIDVQTKYGTRQMRLFISDERKSNKSNYGVILQDLDESNAYLLDLVKVRSCVEESSEQSSFLNLSTLWNYIPGLNYLDAAWENSI